MVMSRMMFDGGGGTTKKTNKTSTTQVKTGNAPIQVEGVSYSGGNNKPTFNQPVTVKPAPAPKASYGGTPAVTSYSGTSSYTQQAAPSGPSPEEIAAQQEAQRQAAEAAAQAQREAEARAEYDRIEKARADELAKALASIPTLEAWLGMDQQYIGDTNAAKTGWGNNMTGWRNNLSQQTSAADFKTALDQLGWRGATVNDYALNDFAGDSTKGEKVTGGLTGGEVSGGGWDKDYTYGAYGSGYQSLMNDAAARGMLNSTGYSENLANFNTDMNNQYSSLLDSRKNTATGIGNTASGGYNDYMAGLARLLADSTERGATKYGVGSLKKNGAGAYSASDLVDPFQYQTKAYTGPVYW